MANILYKKLKRQYTDNGVSWIDMDSYKVGDVLEDPSNCQSENTKQCRWVELDESEGYTCVDYSKYTLKVEECSTDGIIWTRSGNQEKGSLIERKSCDCGYTEEKWIAIDGEYICGENEFTKYEKEVLYIGCGDVWQQVEPYQERKGGILECFSMDCGASSNTLSFTWAERPNNDDEIKIIVNHIGTFYESPVDTTMNDIGVCELTDCSFMFSSGVDKPIHLIKFPDTKYVTNMKQMFGVGITNTNGGFIAIDCSEFNTPNVTNMSGMFCGCSHLLGLDINNWDVSKVEDMSFMFHYCNLIKSLDLSNWDTSNVTDMRNMFCVNYSNEGADTFLTELNLSNWDVSKVTDMQFMFFRQNRLRTLDVSNWDLSNFDAQESTKDNMFEDCCSLRKVIAYDCNIDTLRKLYYLLSNIGGGDYTVLHDEIDIPDDSNLVLLSYSNKPIKLNGKDIESNFLDIINYTDTLTDCSGAFNTNKLKKLVRFPDTSNVIDMYRMFRYCDLVEELDIVSNFNMSNVTEISEMFSNCSRLRKLDLSNWNTSNVVNCSNLFVYCTALTDINLGNIVLPYIPDFAYSGIRTIDLSNVRFKSTGSLKELFRECFNLVSADLSNLDTSGVKDWDQMFLMFSYCRSLKQLNLSNWVLEGVTGSTSDRVTIFQGCDSLERIYAYGCSDETIENINKMISNLENVEIITDTDVMEDIIETSSKVSIKMAYCSNTYYLNNIPYNEEEFTLNYTLTDCTSAFKNTNLCEIKEFPDTSNVRYMKYMFSNCPELISLDLSNWNVSNVLSMYQLFSEGTNKLSYLNLSNWDMVSCEDDIDLSVLPNIRTLEMENAKIYHNLRIPPSVINLNITNLDTTFCDDFERMFWNCSYLKEIDVSSFNTTNATTLYQMFGSCTQIEELDLSSFDTSNVTSMGYMFSNCINLKTLDLSNFNTSKLGNINYMFNDCRTIESINLSNWDLSNATTMARTFDNCNNLKEIIVNNCNEITITRLTNILDNDGFEYTIENGVIKINNETNEEASYSENDDVVFTFAGEFIQYNVNGTYYTATTSPYSFNFSDIGVTEVENLDFTDNVNYGVVTSIKINNMKYVGSHFDINRSYASEIIINNIEFTDNVKYLNNGFRYCRCVDTLDLSNFDVSMVEQLNNFFSDCDNLTTLNLSNWNFKKVGLEYCNNMFAGCYNLKQIICKNCNNDTILFIKANLRQCHLEDKVEIITE